MIQAQGATHRCWSLRAPCLEQSGVQHDTGHYPFLYTETNTQLHYMPGAFPLAAHIVLEWMDAPFEIVEVKREALKNPEYLRLNPMGAVPTLEDGDLVLNENVAILLYLAETHPQAHLADADDPRSRAQVNHWLELTQLRPASVFQAVVFSRPVAAGGEPARGSGGACQGTPAQPVRGRRCRAVETCMACRHAELDRRSASLRAAALGACQGDRPWRNGQLAPILPAHVPRLGVQAAEHAEGPD